MKETLKKYKKRLIAALAVILLAVGAHFSGATIDFTKVFNDAFNGEVTDTAQKLEDAVKVEPITETP